MLSPQNLIQMQWTVKPRPLWSDHVDGALKQSRIRVSWASLTRSQKYYQVSFVNRPVKLVCLLVCKYIWNWATGTIFEESNRQTGTLQWHYRLLLLAIMWLIWSKRRKSAHFGCLMSGRDLLRAIRLLTNMLKPFSRYAWSTRSESLSGYGLPCSPTPVDTRPCDRFTPPSVSNFAKVGQKITTWTRV